MSYFLIFLMMAAVFAGCELPQPDQGSPEGGGGFQPFILIFVIFFIFYIILILPQSRKMKQAQKMRSDLKENDRVVTSGGIVGVITKTKEKSVVIKTANNTTLEILRSSISSNLTEEAKKESQKKSK